jgi:colanic acid biosynthesis protein WcaH
MLTNAIRRSTDIALRADGELSQNDNRICRNQYTDEASGAKTSAPLAAETFASVVANTPLVSIDLIVEDGQGTVLLGLRNNPPASGWWFVPGGRIRKDETLDDAFARITQVELGLCGQRSRSRLVGVYEHFYDTNFTGTTGATTHYVVLAYRLRLERQLLQLPHQQHSQYMWMHPDRIVQHPHVHSYTQAYFLS